MLSIILIIGLIAAVLTIFIVLIQNPKGGGLAANFSSSTQIFGAQRTSEGVEKLTWIFASIILLVSLVASSYNGASSAKGKTEVSTDSKLEEKINAPVPKSSKPMVDPSANPAPPADPTKQVPPQN
jgi:preprotein translocase subunit SecG